MPASQSGQRQEQGLLGPQSRRNRKPEAAEREWGTEARVQHRVWAQGEDRKSTQKILGGKAVLTVTVLFV